MDASSFDLGQFVAQFFSAAKGHNWIIVGGLVCTGLVQLARLEHSFVVKLVPWFGTDRGGVTLNAIIALLVTAGVSLATGKIDLSTLGSAVLNFVLAAGLFNIGQKVALPADKPPVAPAG